MMGLIRRSFIHLDEEMFLKLYKALVRPHLEYANVIWHPTKIKDITAIENVQRRATKYLPSLKNLSYEERLQKLKLPTLRYRRLRGDMIKTYKLMSHTIGTVSQTMLFNHQTSRHLKVNWTNQHWKEYEGKYNFRSTYSPTANRRPEHEETIEEEGAVEEPEI